MKDIVDTAVEAGSFNTLVTAVKAAGLVDALKSQGPFTVFAPADSAFSSLPAGTVESLLKDTEKLTSILKYHVVPGKLMSGQAIQLVQSQAPAKVKTLEGSEVTLKLQGFMAKSLYVNEAKVVKADIEATNGVIHVIDKVILPP